MKTKSFALFFAMVLFVFNFTACLEDETDSESSEQTAAGGELQTQNFSTGENDDQNVRLLRNVPSSFTPYSIKDSERSYNRANVQRWTMISTGQKSCYDNHGEIDCPAEGESGFNQDGSVSYGTRSYVTGSDGTVKDSVTGLIWQRGYVKDKTWYEAKNYCDSLTVANKTWRLPLTHELRSLVNYGVVEPAIDSMAFPDTPSDWFWASKHVKFSSMDSGEQFVASWIISFIDGSVEYTARDNYYSVRCVAE
ncbi:MAG TPA: DUF1566 domain-containing protein [bacterium]|nr:DUF1566 domain-containing protein [bacterium]